MRTIFIVNHESGSYDDYRCVAILATFDEDVAKNKVSEMELRRERRQEILKLIQSHMSAWEAANPRPVVLDYRRKPLPSYPGPQKSWTDEQRAHLAKIKHDNETALESRYKPLSDWAQARHNEEISFRNTFTDQERDDFLNLCHDSTWTIDVIPFA